MGMVITDAQKANWAVAHARQTRSRRLSPALLRAYSAEHLGVPDPEALDEAIEAAQSILSALTEGRKLLKGEGPGAL